MSPIAASFNQSDPAGQRGGRTPGSMAGFSAPQPAAEPGDEAARRTILAETLRHDVIPKLMQSRGAATPPAITAAHVTELTDLTLAADEAGVIGFVADLQAQGIPAEMLYLDLLTACARRLGVFWVEDVCGFTDVTIGLGRLQAALRLLGPAFLGAGRKGEAPVGRAVLMPLPGEQHTFGLSMVADFFRRGGWSVWAGAVSGRAELAAMLRAEWIDVLGFSLACHEQEAALRDEIAFVRSASRNRRIAVMVGGPPFLVDPNLATRVGADGTGVDGKQAVAQADALMLHRGDSLAGQSP